MAKSKINHGFGHEQFAAARKELGLTQEQIAGELDITTRTVQIYERPGSYIPKKIALAVKFLLKK